MVRTQTPHEREYFEGVEEGGNTNKNTHAYFSNINKNQIKMKYWRTYIDIRF